MSGLELWAGLFYLLNKIFFAISEADLSRKRTWEILSWSTYAVGLPAWVIFFIINDRWLAASVEISGLPSMILALIIIIGRKDKEPKVWNIVSLIFVVIGLAVSVYNLNGFSSWTQVLELGIAIGFLVGTYLLARKNHIGYIFFMVMNVFCAILMKIDNSLFLMTQQIASLLIVICAYVIHVKVTEKLKLQVKDPK